MELLDKDIIKNEKAWSLEPQPSAKDITISDGKGADFNEQRDSYARGIANSIFSLMKDEKFMEKVDFRLYWKNEKKAMRQQMKAHEKDMPCLVGLIKVAHDVINSLGGNLEERDDPKDVISWEMLALLMVREIELKEFYPESKERNVIAVPLDRDNQASIFAGA